MTNEDKQYLLNNRCKNDFERNNLNDLFKFLDDNGIEYQRLHIPLNSWSIVKCITQHDLEESPEQRRRLRDIVSKLYKDVTYDIDIYIPKFHWGLNLEENTSNGYLFNWTDNLVPENMEPLGEKRLSSDWAFALRASIVDRCLNDGDFLPEGVDPYDDNFDEEDYEHGLNLEVAPFNNLPPHIEVQRGDSDPQHYWLDYYNAPEFRDSILKKKASVESQAAN